MVPKKPSKRRKNPSKRRKIPSVRDASSSLYPFLFFVLDREQTWDCFFCFSWPQRTAERTNFSQQLVLRHTYGFLLALTLRTQCWAPCVYCLIGATNTCVTERAYENGFHCVASSLVASE